MPHFLLFWYLFFRLHAGLLGGLAASLGLSPVMMGPGIIKSAILGAEFYFSFPKVDLFVC